MVRLTLLLLFLSSAIADHCNQMDRETEQKNRFAKGADRTEKELRFLQAEKSRYMELASKALEESKRYTGLAEKAAEEWEDVSTGGKVAPRCRSCHARFDEGEDGNECSACGRDF